MPSSGDGTAWDVTIPTDSDAVASGPTEIREVKKAVEIRLNKEHVELDASSVGGEHLAGSAKAYFDTSFPTKRPDTTTNLSAADSGRVYVDSATGGLYYYDGAAATWKAVKVVDLTSIADGLLTSAKFASGAAKGLFKFAVIADQKADTTAGGTFTSGAWRTRTLNTEVCDSDTIVTLSSNQFTLAAGTYRLEASVPAAQVDGHTARLRNITDTDTTAVGTASFSPAAVGGFTTHSFIAIEFTITDTKVFEIQHFCNTTKSGNGFGPPVSAGVVEVYTMVKIWKLI